MADNLGATPGTGATLAADDIGGVHYPRAKMSLGDDGSAVDAVGGAGAVGAGVQRVTLASDDPAVAAIGTTTGAAVVTDANGTVQQYLRGLVKRSADSKGAGTAAEASRVSLASDDPAVAALGATTGAAVTTDANGTIQQYLRGLVKRFADALGAGTAAAASRVTLASDDPAVTAIGAVNDVAWDKAAANANAIQILKTLSLDMESVRAQIVNAAAISIVKQLHDNARETWTMMCTEFSTSAAADTMMSTFVTAIGTAAETTGVTGYTVPAGKRLRITGFAGTLVPKSTNNTATVTHVTMRSAASGGSLTTASPSRAVWAANIGTGATATALLNGSIPSEGMEFGPGEIVGFSAAVRGWVNNTAHPLITASVFGHLYDDTP